MEFWLRTIAAIMAGGLALYWRPGLESSQNYITSALVISEQTVALLWLLLSFTWAFVGALVGYSLSSAFIFYLSSGWRRPDTPPTR